jgi:hypothetical protein
VKKYIIPGIIVLLAISFTIGILAFAGVEPFYSRASQLFNRVERTIPDLAVAKVETISIPLHLPLVLAVDIVPSSSAIADEYYDVDLYEKGELRETIQISWNQPEINVKKSKTVNFSLTKKEYDAYVNHDVSHIFSIYVHP